MNEQTPYTGNFSSIQIPNNPEPRCPCALVLDVSGSMSGDAIAQLSDGVHSLLGELSSDPLASRRVELSIVTFGNEVRLVSDFASPRHLIVPPLVAGGGTPMGEAVVKAASMLEARKQEYKNEGLQYFRPWMFLITDGEPTDKETPYWDHAIRIVHDAESRGQMLFFGVAVGAADQHTLNQLCPPKRPSQKLRGLHFREMFVWLTRSLKMVSSSNPGQKMTLPETSGWNDIQL
jgi:uncharacterized protein YegL